MGGSGFYVFLCSEDSRHIFKSNNYKEFYCELDRHMVLEQSCGFGFQQEWRVALVELSIQFDDPKQTLPETIIVLSDLCEPSVIKGSQINMLRTISPSSETSVSLFNTYYIGVTVQSFNRIGIKLRNRDLQELLPSKGWPEKAVLRCCLHFTKN